MTPAVTQPATMFGFSASRLLNWADYVYFGSLAVVAAATVTGFGAGMLQYTLNGRIAQARDAEFKAYRAEADLKISEATRDAALANLELARIKTPRVIPDGQVDALRKAASEFTGMKVDFGFGSGGGSEASKLVDQIAGCLAASGWVVEPWPTGTVVIKSSNRPDMGAIDFDGFAIVWQKGAQKRVIEAATAIGSVLGAPARVASDNEPLGPVPTDTVHILVGEKLIC